MYWPEVQKQAACACPGKSLFPCVVSYSRLKQMVPGCICKSNWRRGVEG